MLFVFTVSGESTEKGERERNREKTEKKRKFRLRRFLKAGKGWFWERVNTLFGNGFTRK